MKHIEDSYPLSPMQQGMLFHSQYAPHSGVYIEQLVCALKEELDVSALKQAWQRLTERHASLRTTFRLAGSEEPFQEVQRNVSIPWKEEDWRSIAQNEQEARLQAFIEADRLQDFEFAKAPLMRLALFRTGEADYRMLWTFHHALLDGRSYFLALKELFAVYEAICQGQHLQLTQPRPYRDYIDWLEKQDWTKGKLFWISTLRGITNPTPVGIKWTDFGQPAKNGFGRQEIRLDKSLTSALRKLAQEHQLTVNSLLQGAWALLLSHYSGEEDVVFGTTRSGRYTTVKGAESMVGLFINTLPLRARVSRESSLLPWLQEIRAHWIAMRDFEHTPLVQIQAWSDIPAGKPLFDSILIFENYDLNSALRAQGKEWEKRDFRAIGTTNYALTVIGYLDPELLLKISYDRCRFDENTITLMAGHFQTLLEGIVADPRRRLSDLPLLTEAERHQLLLEWNETQADYPKDQCIHELFEAQAERSPDAVALMFDGEQLTYRELNRRTNQLAHYLQKLGVGPEILVGICMERSLEMVVGILGILKAGGAYVPLDPEYPKERLAFMLEDTQAPVLLIQERLLARLPEHKAHVVCVDKDWEVIAAEKQYNPLPKVRSDNLAYVIYTSGSTGKPKGVAIEHHSTATLLHWARGVFAREDLAGVLASTSICFDLSVFELFVPISWGGKAILAENALQLPTLSSAKDVSLINTVPSAMAGLLRAGGIPASVRTVNLAGEPLQTSLVKQIHEQGNVERVFDLYGPSEDTTYSTFALRSDDGPATIGRPIANTQIYILDSHLQSVPIGIPGELHIGGAGLARGYLNRPDLTAEKFIADPFSDKRGARLYKTGDLARYLPDGNIEFLGRIDHQVKIRGFRIELGEIEAVLCQHPALREAVVLAREDEAGGKRLVAYVVPHQGQALTIDGLRSFLKQKLPEYMIPSAFVMLDALPLTPSGKVNRRGLPAPDTARPELKGAFVAPRSPIEEALARIWSDILKLEQVGVHDNFFDLGGHSLLATQVMSRLHAAFQVELPLRNLFEAPTVAGLAEHIETLLWAMQGRKTSATPMVGDREAIKL